MARPVAHLGAVALVALAVVGCTSTEMPSATATESLTGSGRVVFTQSWYSCATGGKDWTLTAYLNDRAGTPTVILTFAKLAAGQGPDGFVSFVQPLVVPMTSPISRQFVYGPLDVSKFCGDPYGPGNYNVTVTRLGGAKVLARGPLTITR